MVVDNIKRLFKDSIIYGVGSVAKYLIGFFLLPIYTRVFTPADYGILDTVGTLAGIVSLFLMFGLDSATQRYYFDNKKDGKLIISTSFWFVAVVSFSVCLILIMGFSGFFSNLFFNTNIHSKVLTLAILSIPASLLISLSQNTLRLKFAPWRYNIITLFQIISSTTIIFFLVVVLKKGIFGNFLGGFIATIITLIVGTICIRSKIIFRFSSVYLKKMLKYGTTLMFAGFAYWVLSLSDRFFIVKLSTLEQVGLYSIGNKISSILILFITALSLAWPPLLFAYYKKKEGNRFIIKVITYSTILFSSLAVLLTAFGHDILKIIAPSTYIEAAWVIGILSLGLAFLGISGMFATGISLSKKTKYLTLSSVIAAVLNIILNIILIPKIGIIGAAIATLISYIVLAFLNYFYSQKLYYLEYEIGKILKVLTVAVIFVTIGTFVKFDNILISLLIKIVFVSVFILCLYILKIFSKEEIGFIKKVYLKLLSNKNKFSIFK